MMTPAQIRAEFDRFIEFPPGSDRCHVTTTSTLLFAEHIAALAAQAERESRQAAQAENEQLKARLARSGVELRKAVMVEREACAKVCDAFAGTEAHGATIAEYIRASNHVVDVNKMDCADCDCADNEPCKRTAPGFALESSEFVPAEKITDWSAA